VEAQSSTEALASWPEFGTTAFDALNPVDGYALDVVSGRLPAGKYHRLACLRHLKDRCRENTPEFPFRFEYERAARFFRFAGALKHYKGKQFAGKPITLTPVQQYRLGSIFGWRHVETGLRRFTTAYNELPRKSGKTLEAAVVALYVTFFEGEPGAEGYCIATKRQQAKLVFDAARQLVRSSGLKSRIETLKSNLSRDKTQQKLEPIGADADSTDGLNPYLIITDEFHAHKNRDLVDVMESGTGARLTFLHFIITTAGDDLLSPCGQQHEYVCKILDGVFTDEATESTFAFIAHADLDDDPLDEETWKKANPHYGISVNPEDIRKLALKAKNMPGAMAEFKQKRLNIWVNAGEPWLSLEGWRAGQSAVAFGEKRWQQEDLRDQRCYVGIDLSSKLDITAVVALFPPTEQRPTWRGILRAFTPEDTLKDRAHRDRAPYEQWVKEGWLETTPGKRIDQAIIRAAVVDLDEIYEVCEIGFDPWNAGNIDRDLVAEDEFANDQIIEVPQVFAHMSVPSKDFEAEVLEEHVDFGGHPLMQWCVANAVVQKDGKDNIQPIKKKSRGRIDGVVAAVIARKLAGHTDEGGESAYSDGHGLVVA
jgi:phage terminase large subunit-like protein